MTLDDLLRSSTERDPDRPLLIHRGRTTPYASVDRGANRHARLLRDLGVGRGDRVGLLLPNGRDYVESYYGILRAGAIAVPLHAGTDARTLRSCLTNCGARAVITGGRGTGRLEEVAGELPELRAVVLPGEEPGDDLAGRLAAAGTASLAAQEDAPTPAGAQDHDRAMIVYTSGSTGSPRGAVLSHAAVAANTRQILAYLRLSPVDRVSVVLPFPYVYGKSLLNTHVAAGGSLVLHDSLMFPNAVLDEMERHEVTGFSGVPSTFALLLNRSDLAQRALPALRYVTQAGGAMPAEHQRRLVRAVPGARVFIMYGATEASARLTYLDPDELDARAGSIGKPLHGISLTVRRDDGSAADVGETGELVARGPNMMEGYWNDPVETAAVLDEHGFHTGDLGYRDDAGFFWVTGRKREMIKSGAHRVSPREVEDALLAAPGVDEAAVLGVPDDFLGQAIVAHVTLRPGAEVGVEALMEHARGRLPAHKTPRRIVVRASLPRSPAGKVDKRALLAEEGEGS